MVEYRPEKSELEEAKEIAAKGIEKASKSLPKTKEVKIGFGWTEDPFVLNNMDGVSGKSYSETYFTLNFNTEIENWKDSLLAQTVHEYGHTWFYEQLDKQYAKLLWRYIIDEALTQNLTEKLVPEFESPWRKKHSKKAIAEYWPQIKENLDRDVNHPDPLYINQSKEGYPNWLGYSLSYLIGKELLEKHELEDFNRLEKQDVIKAGDRIFGGE